MSRLASPTTLTVTVMLSPAFSVPEDWESETVPSKEVGTVIDQVTGPPAAVSVSLPLLPTAIGIDVVDRLSVPAAGGVVAFVDGGALDGADPEPGSREPAGEVALGGLAADPVVGCGAPPPSTPEVGSPDALLPVPGLTCKDKPGAVLAVGMVGKAAPVAPACVVPAAPGIPAAPVAPLASLACCGPPDKANATTVAITAAAATPAPAAVS